MFFSLPPSPPLSLSPWWPIPSLNVKVCVCIMSQSGAWLCWFGCFEGGSAWAAWLRWVERGGEGASSQDNPVFYLEQKTDKSNHVIRRSDRGAPWDEAFQMMNKGASIRKSGANQNNLVRMMTPQSPGNLSPSQSGTVGIIREYYKTPHSHTYILT